jgi:hypothetical protein
MGKINQCKKRLFTATAVTGNYQRLKEKNSIKTSSGQAADVHIVQKRNRD